MAGAQLAASCKTVTFTVGFGPGGGYDLYARVLGQHIANHIPGKPNVVTQNMEGAGSVRAANFVYNTAPRDGTTIAAVNQNMPMLPKVVDVIGEDRTYQGQVFSDEMHFVCHWQGYEYGALTGRPARMHALIGVSDLKTGECAGDRRLKLRKYQVVDRDGAIYVIA